MTALSGMVRQCNKGGKSDTRHLCARSASQICALEARAPDSMTMGGPPCVAPAACAACPFIAALALRLRRASLAACGAFLPAMAVLREKRSRCCGASATATSSPAGPPAAAAADARSLRDF